MCPNSRHLRTCKCVYVDVGDDHGRSVRPGPDGQETLMGGAALLAVGSALILLGRFGGELTGASSSDLGWKQWTVLLVGIALLVAGAWLAAPPRDESAGRLRPILPVAVAGIGLLLIWWLLVALDQSLWHDEAFSALVYTSHGPSSRTSC